MSGAITSDPLTALHGRGRLSPLDAALGRHLGALVEPHHATAVALAVALASRRLREGHTLTPLAAWGGQFFPEEDESDPEAVRLPAADAWREALVASAAAGACGSGQDSLATPLVLVGDGVGLRRMIVAEAAIAARLERSEVRAEAPTPHIPRGRLDDAQWAAVAAVLRRRVTVLTGGPGTGKTSTAGHMLAALVKEQPDLRIALAAPTGKAATRLAQAVGSPATPLPAAQRQALAAGCTTLHRLLGYHPGEDRFRHHADEPLACDVLLIDESSMLGAELSAALLHALPEHARLILLGDAQQLPAVEAGAVLADLVAAGGDRVLRLTTDHRAGTQPGLVALAAALRAGAAPRVHELLAPGGDPAAELHRASDAAALLALATPRAEALACCRDARTALTLLASEQVLCATRTGPGSVAAITAELDAAAGMSGRGIAHGRPLLITANDHHLDLANGDLGLCWQPDPAVPPVALFPGGDGGRRIAWPWLPPYEPAWALTIHKSQGSEWPRVLISLPPAAGRARPSPLLTRELFYTAVTRARHKVVVAADDQALELASTRQTRRDTVLGLLLRR